MELYMNCRMYVGQAQRATSISNNIKTKIFRWIRTMLEFRRCTSCVWFLFSNHTQLFLTYFGIFILNKCHNKRQTKKSVHTSAQQKIVRRMVNVVTLLPPPTTPTTTVKTLDQKLLPSPFSPPQDR